MLEVFEALHPAQLEMFVVFSVASVLAFSVVSTLARRMQKTSLLVVSVLSIIPFAISYLLLNQAQNLDPASIEGRKDHYFKTLYGLLPLAMTAGYRWTLEPSFFPMGLLSLICCGIPLIVTGSYLAHFSP